MSIVNFILRKTCKYIKPQKNKINRRIYVNKLHFRALPGAIAAKLHCYSVAQCRWRATGWKDLLIIDYAFHSNMKICFLPQWCNYTLYVMMSLFLWSYISMGLYSVLQCRHHVARTAVRRSLSQRLFPASVRWNQTALKAVNNIHQKVPFKAPAFHQSLPSIW